MVENLLIDYKVFQGMHKKLGLEKFNDTYLQPFSFYKRFTKKVYDCNNIIGKITGTKHPEKYIVLTAHYDHVGEKNDKIYNGADDNASGISGILAAAAFYKKNPPKHSIIIIAFDAEELGLEGAKGGRLPGSKEDRSRVAGGNLQNFRVGSVRRDMGQWKGQIWDNGRGKYGSRTWRGHRLPRARR